MDENTPLPPDPASPPGVSGPEAPPEPEAAAPEAEAPREPEAPPEPETAAPVAEAPREPARDPAPESEPTLLLLPAPEPAPLLLPAPGHEHEDEHGHEHEHEDEHEAPLPEEPPHAADTAPVLPAHDHLAEENAQRIEAGIEALRTGYREGQRRKFRAFFEHERKLHGLFKELQPLHPHDRHRLWKTLKQVGADARQAQHEEWESRRYQSIEARETVEEKLRAAEALTRSAEGGADYRRAESLLNEIRNLLANVAPGSPGQLLIGPDRRACWNRWRSLRDALRQEHGGRQEQAHRELSALVAEVAGQTAEGDPFQVTQRIKELQARLGRADLRRRQFEELRKRLSAAWQQAQGRMAGQRHERSRQRTEWRGRIEQHLPRWRQALEQERGQLAHLVEQASKLIDMEKRARSEDFAEQVRQWQAITAEKRRRTGASVAELEKRIRDAERRLGGRRPKPARTAPPGTPRPSAEPQGEPAEPQDGPTKPKDEPAGS
jgi:hypothetical protein